MKIAFWDVSEATKVTNCYNEQIASVPYCYPVSQEELKRAFCYQLHEALEEHKPYAEKELVACFERKLLVGWQDGGIVGFADIGKQQREETGEAIGLIRLLTYRPGCRTAGQAMLEHAERYFRDLGLHCFEAFTHKTYYFFRHGSSALPGPMWHVQALFRINGYRFATWDDGDSMGWCFFHLPQYRVEKPVFPDASVQVDTQHIPGRGQLPNLEINLYRNGEPIANSWSLSSEHYCLNPQARTTFNTEGLHVAEPERGKGLGRYLLQRTLWEMQQLGYQTATLHCSVPNSRAHLLYTNAGYRVVDASCAFVKRGEGGV